MIDPWASTSVDYDKLINQFGIEKISDIIGDIKDPQRLMKRGVVFGHREFNQINDLINKKEDFAVVTGMMPSGQMHIGHKMVVDQLIWYQKKGAMLSLPIADLESYAARNMSFEKGKQIAVEEYLTNWIALGLDLEKDNVNVYLQSQNKSLFDLEFKASRKTNFSQLHAIYGFDNSTNIAHVQAPLMQVADILLPQIEEFGGPKKVVVPVGVDQDPHIRLTRDIAHRLNEELGFIQPASTYHRFLTGLTGDKMSSSKPNTAIYLNEEPEVAAKKVKTAKTGGRESLKEQEELGGEVDKCVIYEMLVYHLIDDDGELEKIREECLSGNLRCGDCKAKTAELMQEYFEDLKDKQVEASEIAQTIL
ncbi:MAG: tryptophan--tRNA ligase [Methanobrevibacter sp.]|uniref:Tryptophan--tRNA ligase n=1 Tax=Methanobrevibacter millerae TaxID=230361 RepID=A0A8T3VH55_9EURY|nr:tryptophan--tRNA ligase [Methanobrevibacter millerae]MBE6504673.1 tryptophan--tRNA ligase [Methanobrevibacter millerae]MBR0059209.1 tryptophan--tRNA ligase [Methanobrevibacter sp.]